MITANKLQCQTSLGAWGTEANCVARVLRWFLVSTFSAPLSLGHLQKGTVTVTSEGNGEYIADFSLVYVPSSNPYMWRSFFYAFIPNCTDTYDFTFTVTCTA
jgi:hypothetical protein